MHPRTKTTGPLTTALCASFAVLMFGVAARGDDASELFASVSRFELLALDVPTDRAESFLIEVPIDGVVRQIELRRVSVWSPNATVKVYRGDGSFDLQPAPPPNTYRGTVTELPDSIVTAGIKNDGLHAIIRLAGRPKLELLPADGTGLHMLYSVDDRASEPMHCDQPPERGDRAAAPARAPGQEDGPRGMTVVTAELALEADVEYYTELGGVADTLDEMALVVNNFNPTYEVEIGITHVLTAAIVRTAEPDLYNSNQGATINQQQVNEWTANQSHLAYDAVLLFTGKDTCDGANCNLAGRAFDIGVVCDRAAAFCFTEYRSSDVTHAQIAGHEMGHLWDGRHCDNDSSSPCYGYIPCLLMSSTINGCQNSGFVEFDWCTANAIAAFRDSCSCFGPGTTEVQWVEWRVCDIFCPEDGDFEDPHNTLAEAVEETSSNGTIIIKSGNSGQADGDEEFPLVISKPLLLRSFNGSAAIGY